MAKPKSLKLRTLITFYALFKHADQKHRLNSIKLNKYLRPYGLDCTARVLGDTVKVLKSVGFDIESKGEWEHQGVWIKNRPLSEDELNYLVYAVTSNPHLSKKQATDVLQCLKPFVTVYQEDMLSGFVETKPTVEPDDSLYWVYSVIRGAIKAKRRIRYSVEQIRYDEENKTVNVRTQLMTLFTPKCVYQGGGRLYMVGYNHNIKKVAAVDLSKVVDIKIAFKHKDINADKIKALLDSVSPEEIVPGKTNPVVYSGPVTFRCRGQYLAALYNRFGPPNGPVLKDKRGKTVYSVNNATITTETLFWLSQIPDCGVRVVGPDEVTEKIKEYYQKLSNTLLDTQKL